MRDIKKISIDLIKPNRYQPRVVFDDDKIIELSQSIKNNGLIQPIVLRESDNHYEIIAGERRYRACILAGLVEVDAIILDVDLQELGELALVENTQREDLSAIEEAKALKLLSDKYKITQKELGKKIGKSQSTIANKIRLLNLDESVQDAVVSRSISERHARNLLSVDKELQKSILDEIIKKDLTVNETEKLIKRKIVKPENTKPKTRGFSRNHQLAINTIKQSITMINDFGLDVEVIEENHDDEIVMIIKIKK